MTNRQRLHALVRRGLGHQALQGWCIRVYPQLTVPVIVSGRLDLLQAQFGHHLLAHDKFLDLAGYGHRKRLEKRDIAGNFVVGNLPTAKLLELVWRGDLPSRSRIQAQSSSP